MKQRLRDPEETLKSKILAFRASFRTTLVSWFCAFGKLMSSLNAKHSCPYGPRYMKRNFKITFAKIQIVTNQKLEQEGLPEKKKRRRVLGTIV